VCSLELIRRRIKIANSLPASYTYGIIGQIGLHFGSNPVATSDWTIHNIFYGSDSRAGFACAFVGSVGTLYYRNASTEYLEAQRLDFSNAIDTWETGRPSKMNRKL
jgi:hypothetical protein